LLEGTKLPFLVWTNHLEYIHTGKKLNSLQARWSLFFTRFVFHLAYRPGSRNVKPDTLSCQFLEKEDPATRSKPILSSPCRVTTLTWEIKD